MLHAVSKLKSSLKLLCFLKSGSFYDLLHEVVLSEFLLQLVIAPGVLPTQELQETLRNLNLLQLFVRLRVVLCVVVIRVDR